MKVRYYDYLLRKRERKREASCNTESPLAMNLSPLFCNIESIASECKVFEDALLHYNERGHLLPQPPKPSSQCTNFRLGKTLN